MSGEGSRKASSKEVSFELKYKRWIGVLDKGKQKVLCGGNDMYKGPRGLAAEQG